MPRKISVIICSFTVVQIHLVSILAVINGLLRETQLQFSLNRLPLLTYIYAALPLDYVTILYITADLSAEHMVTD